MWAMDGDVVAVPLRTRRTFEASGCRSVAVCIVWERHAPLWKVLETGYVTSPIPCLQELPCSLQVRRRRSSPASVLASDSCFALRPSTEVGG